MYTPFTKILSARGTQLKTQEDHIFTRSSKYNENHYYVCIKKNSSRCKTRLTLKTNTDSISVYNNEHNHEIDVIETTVKQVRSDIKSKSTSSESTKRIIAEIVGDYPDEVLHKLPSTDAMAQRIR